MPATIGILGESTVVAVGSVTVYTVPTNRAARVRILIGVQGGAVGTHGYSVRIGMPGNETNICKQIASTIDFFSGIIEGVAQNSRDVGLQDIELGAGVESTNADRATIVPWPHDFYLSAGDTVVFQIVTNGFADHIFQVQGVEDDV